MANEQRTPSTYKSLGAIDIPVVSYREGYAKASGKPGSIFYMGFWDPVNVNMNDPSAIEQSLPDITEKQVAFDIKIVNVRGKTIATKKVLITKVIDYAYSLVTGNVELEFEWIPLESEYDGCPEVPPIITHMLLKNSYLGIILEGDYEATLAYASNNLAFFRHGNKIYHQHNMRKLTRLYGTPEDKKYEYIGIMVVCTDSALEPDEKDTSEFVDYVMRFIDSVYYIDRRPLL